MPSISWSESAPANSDNLGLGAQEIRSFKTAVRTGLDAEHVWPSTGGDAGVHRLGSARAYVGPASQVSSSGTEGRLLVNSTDSSLWHVGPTVGLLGHPFALITTNASGTTYAPAARVYTSVQYGVNRTGSAGVVSRHTFSGSGFSGVPMLQVTPLDADSSGAGYGTIVRVLSVSNVGFTVVAEDTQSTNQSNVTFYWMSIGTTASGVA